MRGSREWGVGSRATRRFAAALATLIVASVVGLACAQDSSAQSRALRRPVERDDPSAINKLLDVVRGVDPVLCELATRSVDMHGSWNRFDLSDSPLQTDSAAAAVLDWIQHAHNDPALVPMLRNGMRDPDACVRRISGSFLGRIDHPSAAEALLVALDDPNAGTRYVAAMGLGMGDRSVGVERLMNRLRDDSPQVRRASAWALGAMEALAAKDALIDLLGRDADPRVRQVAAWALGRIAD